MSKTSEKTDPKLWEKVKEKVTRSDKGGRPGQWSARKAQMAVQEYKKEGGSYEGEKSEDNSLVQWTEEEWGTKSGRDSEETGERYLPKAARAALSDEEYKKTSDKKRADTAKGEQFSKQPKAVAEKAARARTRAAGERTKADLMAEAKTRAIPGRSRMTKEQLQTALAS